MEVKQALRDPRFRDSLPIEFQEDVAKYLQNPGCACNIPIYRKIIKEALKQLQTYYPGRDIVDEQEEIKKLVENKWTVINCRIDELQNRLKQLPPGRKQLDVARWEDQVTVVINEIDIIY